MLYLQEDFREPPKDSAETGLGLIGGHPTGFTTQVYDGLPGQGEDGYPQQRQNPHDLVVAALEEQETPLASQDKVGFYLSLGALSALLVAAAFWACRAQKVSDSDTEQGVAVPERPGLQQQDAQSARLDPHSPSHGFTYRDAISLRGLLGASADVQADTMAHIMAEKQDFLKAVLERMAVNSEGEVRNLVQGSPILQAVLQKK